MAAENAALTSQTMEHLRGHDDAKKQKKHLRAPSRSFVYPRKTFVKELI